MKKKEKRAFCQNFDFSCKRCYNVPIMEVPAREIQHMKITLNGTEINSDAYKNLEELLTSLLAKKEGIIVELNETIIRKNQWKEHSLKEGDKIEVIEFVGGG